MTRHSAHPTTTTLFSLLLCAALALASPALGQSEDDYDTGDAMEQTADEVKADTKSAAETTKDVISDAAITAKVKSKLTANPVVNPFDIDVDTTDGVVRLTGTVGESIDRSEAERLALDTAGVVRVENELQLETSQIAADDEGDFDAADDELPATASSLPLFLALGLGSLAAAAGVRRERS